MSSSAFALAFAISIPCGFCWICSSATSIWTAVQGEKTTAGDISFGRWWRQFRFSRRALHWSIREVLLVIGFIFDGLGYVGMSYEAVEWPQIAQPLKFTSYLLGYVNPVVHRILFWSFSVLCLVWGIFEVLVLVLMVLKQPEGRIEMLVKIPGLIILPVVECWLLLITTTFTRVCMCNWATSTMISLPKVACFSLEHKWMMGIALLSMAIMLMPGVMRVVMAYSTTTSIEDMERDQEEIVPVERPTWQVVYFYLRCLLAFLHALAWRYPYLRVLAQLVVVGGALIVTFRVRPFVVQQLSSLRAFMLSIATWTCCCALAIQVSPITWDDNRDVYIWLGGVGLGSLGFFVWWIRAFPCKCGKEEAVSPKLRSAPRKHSVDINVADESSNLLGDGSSSHRTRGGSYLSVQ